MIQTWPFLGLMGGGQGAEPGQCQAALQVHCRLSVWPRVRHWPVLGGMKPVLGWDSRVP